MTKRPTGAALVVKLAAPVVIAVMAMMFFMPVVIGIGNGIKNTVQKVNVILSTGKLAN